MSGSSIRALVPTDAAAWLREHPTAFLASEEEERARAGGVAERLAAPPDRAVIFGAFHEGALIGTVGLGRVATRKQAHTAIVWGVYVAPEHRGRGLGRRLLETAIDAARAMPGVERLGLSVDERNEGARRLYESLGFEAWGTEPDAFRAEGRGVDEVHMILRLQDDLQDRLPAVFFEVYEALPRQGPGNLACAKRALALCEELPPRPAILDLGCGVGGQTLHLTELLGSGLVVAVDRHAPSIERLARTAFARGLSHRIVPLACDMGRLPFAAASFDLVWSEGALYNLGLERALPIARALLRPGGYLAFTDAVYRSEDPPPEVKAAFDADYPSMGRVPDVLRAIERSGLALVEQFMLPDEAWWDDFYTPMLSRIAELRRVHAGDAGALAVLDQLAREPEMHRAHARHYAYAFFVARRPA